MEITKREILASVTIIAIMILIGFVIVGRIDAHQVQKNSEYYSALQITDAEQFQYGMDTSVGNAFVYGTLEAADPVTYPEIGGEYLYVEKVEEHYNMHTRTVTTTDSKGNTIHTLRCIGHGTMLEVKMFTVTELSFSGLRWITRKSRDQMPII